MRRRPATLLVLLFGVLWLVGLGAYPLLETTEGRYGSVATAMVESGDWIEPSYNGAPLFSKPPLAYWTGAVALSLRPHSEAALRFVGSLWLLVCVLAIARLARLAGLSGRSATWAAVFAGLSPLAVVQGHMNTGDIHLWAGVMSVFVGLLDEDLPGWVRAVLVGVGWSVGFLAKGHMVFFWTLIPPLGALAGLRFRQLSLRPLAHPLAWLLLILLGAPWFAVVIHRHPDLVGYWLGSETMERVTSTVHGRSEPWWFFLVEVPLLLLPWLPELIRGARRGSGSRSHRVLWWVWIVLPLVVLSLSGSKRPNYLLPMIAPLALLAASGIESGRSLARVPRTVAWALIVLAFPFVIALFDLAPPTRELVRRAERESAPLICFDTEPSSLVFYRGATVPVFDPGDDRFPGHMRGARVGEAELPAWIDRRALVIVRARDLPRLIETTGARFETLLEAKGKLLVRAEEPAGSRTSTPP